ncbi:MAG: hypothetical protein AAF702_43335 [Chloroflexota bacterium]
MRTSSLMEQIITRIAQKHEVDLSVVGSRINLSMEGYLPLVIEATQERQIQIAHFFQENFDIVPDPCITFVVVSEGQWVPIDKTESIGGLRSFGYADDEKVVITDIQGQSELVDYADRWAEDIRSLGWQDRADVTISNPLDQLLKSEDWIPF